MKHLVVVAAIMLAAAAAYAAGGEAGGANPGSGVNRALDMDRPGDTNFDRPAIPNLPADRSIHGNRAGDAPDMTDPAMRGRDTDNNPPTTDRPGTVDDQLQPGNGGPGAGPGSMR
jgi:hypothetical protein